MSAPDPKEQAADAFIAAQVREVWAAMDASAGLNRSKPSVGIRCPKCGAAEHVLKYVRQRPTLTRRFRHCLGCGKRFRTTERAD